MTKLHFYIYTITSNVLLQCRPQSYGNRSRVNPRSGHIKGTASFPRRISVMAQAVQ